MPEIPIPGKIVESARQLVGRSPKELSIEEVLVLQAVREEGLTDIADIASRYQMPYTAAMTAVNTLLERHCAKLNDPHIRLTRYGKRAANAISPDRLRRRGRQVTIQIGDKILVPTLYTDTQTTLNALPEYYLANKHTTNATAVTDVPWLINNWQDSPQGGPRAMVERRIFELLREGLPKGEVVFPTKPSTEKPTQ